MLTKGIGGHHQAYKGATDEWLTPPSIIKALGPFDLDPCAPIIRPWPTAARHYTIADDGLSKDWGVGRVWLNPPYGPETGKWLTKLADHGSGTALVFARTETEMFFATVWNRADAIFFLQGRLHFHNANGVRAKANSGAPSVLIAYGEADAAVLESTALKGKFVRLKPKGI